MKLSVNGMNHIKNWEGLRLKAYKCPAGVWTIGYGHTGPDVKPGGTITQAQADALLDKDTDDAESAVNTLVKVPLSQNQFDALVSFVFNTGIGSFKNSTLLRLLNQGNYDAVPAQLKRWVHDGNGRVLAGLVNRRNDEIEIWNDAVTPSATPAQPPKPGTGLNARIKAKTQEIRAALDEIDRMLG